MRGKWAWVGGWSFVLAACGSPPRGSPELPTELTLLHTSDVHSRMWSFRDRVSRADAELGLGAEGALAEVGGAARLATLLATERRQGAELWVDSGDLLEGAPVFGAYGGSVEVELWSALGVAAMALGNHELSLSAADLAALLRDTTFPVLAANLDPAPGSALAGLLLRTQVRRAGGILVGLVGVANPESPPNLSAAGNPWGLRAAPDLALAVQAAVDEAAARSELVIVLSHLGLDADRELLRATSGVDLLLGGHQHVLTVEPEWLEDCGAELAARRGCSPRRVAIVHSGAYAKWLSRLELSLRRDDLDPSRMEVTDVSLRHLPLGSRVPEAPAVLDYLAERAPAPEPPVAFLREGLARSARRGGDAALGNAVADAMQRALGADVAVLNSSGLRADLEAGVLLREDLELAFPFEEPWRVATVTGEVLRRGLLRAARKTADYGCHSALQVAGLRLSIRCDVCRQGGAECLRVSRAGPRGEQPLADDERLLLALPDYVTLAGNDFDAVHLSGTLTDVSVTQALVALAQSQPSGSDTAACTASLLDWSPSRCRQAFGATQCPLSLAAAGAICRRLPSWEEGRHGRIQVLR